MNDLPCPCGSPENYKACCKPSHEKVKSPEVAVALMRSRYVAYVLGLVAYLVDTTHPKGRPQMLREDLQRGLSTIRWIGLEILSKPAGEKQDKIGKVEFEAVYVQNDQSAILHEISRFKRYEGRWMYVYP